MPAARTPIIEDIVDLHFEEAAYLWSQRDAASTATNYFPPDLAYLDERVEAHIDGLRVAGDYGWGLCEGGMDPEDPGTLFVAAVIAFESGDQERIDLVVDASTQSRKAFRAVVSGLGWMNNKRFNASIGGLVSNKSRPCRRLGIAACGMRRMNPRGYLDQAVNSGDLFLKAIALKAVGELKRVDLLPQLQTQLQHEDHVCRFQAAKSAVLLGDTSAIDTLSTFVLSQSRLTLPAMQVALRVAESQKVRNWLQTLSKNPKTRRHVLMGIGIAGDPAYIPMLIKQMANPELARVAGDAFSMITGADLVENKLESDWPEGYEAGPNDDPEDEDVAMDEDEGLSWPDAGRVAQWWEKTKASLPPGNRYLAGGPVSLEHCSHVLEAGNQRNRQAAALELALVQPEAGYVNSRKPLHRPTKRY